VDCTYPPGTAEPRNHFDLPEVLAFSQSYPDSEIVLMHVGHRLDEWLLTRPHALPDRVTLARDGKTLICTVAA
jgi:phosphoribosyl 1,2-cyclic phosphate phosphodiesterase